MLALRFQWKKALGSIAERPGHWDIWGYWNDDGAFHKLLFSLLFA